jgi:ribosomal-protein-alanine N-acetyltransferase
MTYDQLFLAAALVVFLVTFVATMLYVRQRGHDPKGVAGGNTGMDGGISIAKADIADAPAIYELASHYSGATQVWAQERINDLISDSQGHYVLVAKQLDSTVGYAIARFAWGKMHVWDIAVREDMRRRGIGKKMMSQLIDHAKSKHLSEVYLEVRASNTPAVKMYQSLSFKIRFRMPGMYDGEDGLAMYLPLLQEGGKQGREDQHGEGDVHERLPHHQEPLDRLAFLLE